MEEDRLRVAIYGATGNVGLEAIVSMLNHPLLKITHLYAGKSAGKLLREACELDISHLPENILKMGVEYTDMGKIPKDIDIAFFAFPEEVSKKLELKYAYEFAKYMTLITTSSALRMHDEVPLIIIEVNANHVKLAEDYRRNYNSKGAIFPQCNCTADPVVVSLKPLLDTVGIDLAFIDTYQSVSGAGAKALKKWEEERVSEKGLSKPFSYTVPLENPEIRYEGNIRPIGDKDSKGEEEKVENESLKMLGRYESGKIIPANFLIDSMCDRTSVYKGHYEHIRVKPIKSCTREEVISIYEEFNEKCKELYKNLWSKPEQAIILLDRNPQPIYDVNLGKGLSTIIGEIEVKNGWIKFRALSDNLRKGAATGSIQLLEHLYTTGFIRSK